MRKQPNVAAKPISGATRRRIEAGLRDLGDPNSDTRKRFEAARDKWDKVFKPLDDAIARSGCLTEVDLEIVVNA